MFCAERACFLPWLSGMSFVRVGGTLYPFLGLSRALGLGGGLGRCGHQAPSEKAPNGVGWPITSLAVGLSFWHSKTRGCRWGWGWACQCTWTAVGKGCQGAPSSWGGMWEIEARKGRGSRWRHWRERPVSGNASEEPVEPNEANVCVKCEKAGKPREFQKSRQAGKGGMVGNFKGT